MFNCEHGSSLDEHQSIIMRKNKNKINGAAKNSSLTRVRKGVEIIIFL